MRRGKRGHNHGKTRRGENTKQPAGTESAEPADSGASGELSVVSSATASDGRDGPGGPGAAPARRSPLTSRESTDDAREYGRHGVPAPLAEATQDALGKEGREVTGTLIGSPDANREGKLAFGAPGLHSAGGGGSEETWTAVAIGVGALAFALGGSQWERRHRAVLP